MKRAWNQHFLSGLSFVLLLSASCAGGPRIDVPAAPVTPVERVVETIHGVEIADDYRWLENGDDGRVKAWADAQNDRTRAALDAVPGRGKLRARIEALNSIGRVMSPILRKNRVFYQKRSGLQNQPVVYVRDGFEGTPKTVLDPNTFSADGTVALDWWHPSRDGSLVAYGTSEGGSEISTLQILDVDGRRTIAEKIPYCRAASVAWLSDGSAFYYTKYPVPGSVPAGEEKYHRRIYFHKLGSDSSEDPLVFGEGRKKEDWPAVALSPDDRWLLAAVFQGWSKSELYLKDRTKEDAPWVPVVEGVEASTSAILLNDRILFHTDDGAPRHRILSADPQKPEREHWKELIPEGEANLEDFEVAGGRIVTRELHRAYSRLRVFDLDGRSRGEIPLPTLGSVSALSGEWNGDSLVFDFESFFTPSSLHRYETGTARLSCFERVETDVDPGRYESRQVEYASKDGTKITMFVVHRKGLERDGRRPTLLYGYGGFNQSMTPYYSGSRILWLDAGGVFAVPNLRGGGEYGESWHESGKLAKKQNVFDDFHAAAEWLIREGYTDSRHLAISGGSNGGLLVGAAVTQRPELFRAAICAVPLLDMVRYHRFLIAKLWIPEYGSSEDPEQFRILHAYSPYHRVRDGSEYPAVLLMTADTDTRVDPLHARKMAARLQAATGSTHPILLRVEKKAGHGAGKPLSKAIDEAVDQYSFLFWQFGMAAE